MTMISVSVERKVSEESSMSDVSDGRLALGGRRRMCQW